MRGEDFVIVDNNVLSVLDAATWAAIHFNKYHNEYIVDVVSFVIHIIESI